MLKVTSVASGLGFPPRRPGHPAHPPPQAPGKKKWSTETVYAITSLAPKQATPAQLAAWIGGHWRIETLDHIRDITYGEDASQIRTGNGPQTMAALRSLAVGIRKTTGLCRE